MTNHTQKSLQMSRHFLDWRIKPFPFKIYYDLPYQPLPATFPIPATDTLSALKTVLVKTTAERINLQTLSTLLFFTGGITRSTMSVMGDYYLRAASATGALYPIEIYVVASKLPDLEAGVYHFGAADFTLTKLRSGDFRYILAEATSDPTVILHSPINLVFTSLAWRNAWKYQTRSYRHWYWDCGVMIANLLAVASSENLQSKVMTAFLDPVVNKLLFLENNKEATIAIVPVGIGNSTEPTIDQRMLELEETNLPRYIPLSSREVDYPAIWSIHNKTSFNYNNDLSSWTTKVKNFKYSVNTADIREQKVETALNESKEIGKTILQRGSTRRFAKKDITLQQLSRICDASLSGIVMDSKTEPGDSWMELYVIANAVSDLPTGSYYFDRQAKSMLQLSKNASRSIAGYLCLGQELFADASAVLVIMTRLKDIIEHFGDRAYRATQLEGGIVAGKIYLSAYAQGIGASGSTFFDEDVTIHFSPHAALKVTMIVVGVGIPDYKAKSGKLLAYRLDRQKIIESFKY
jgi:SagB-type dehydrogenase family enzyme